MMRPDVANHQAPVGEHAGAAHGHPGNREYIYIAVILAVITACEVLVYYQPALKGVLVPILFILSITKFTLVAMFFMHLKFDSKAFSLFFVGGLLLASGVLVALLSMFHRVLFGV